MPIAPSTTVDSRTKRLVRAWRAWSPLLALAVAALLMVSLGRADAPPGRYVIAAGQLAGTVADTSTQLVWQQDGTASGVLSAADAKAYCATLTLAGGGWRSPGVNEFQTLVDPSVVLTDSRPIFDPTAFPGTPSQANWWLAPFDPLDPSNRYCGGGAVRKCPSVDAFRVRCVR